MVEHGQHRIQAQSSLRVGVCLVPAGMGIGIDAGCQGLQLLHSAGLVCASLLDGLMESAAACMQRETA